MRFRSLVLLAALLFLAGCARGNGEVIPFGTYAGVDANDHQVSVSVEGDGVTVSGVKTDVDPTADNLTFTVQEAGKPEWVCVSMDQGMSCKVTSRGKTSTIQLMRE